MHTQEPTTGGQATVSVEVTATEPEGTSERPPAAPSPSLSRGTSIGRYLLLGALGTGGMGRIFAAYDPDLDRRIALKLLRPMASTPRRQRRLEQRLLVEAKTLARLNHPHVVTVHDVGTVLLDGESVPRVFVAMELVEGSNLAQWMAARPRSTDEVVRVFAQAGRGLAAAHAAGVVHRDFKPANVLVGRNGRVRVCDFGLAQPAAQSPVVPLAEGILELADVADADPDRLAGGHLAGRGSVAGTPAYMAPEQRSGAEVTPAADQYAFCVSLAKVLGRLPAAADGGPTEPTGDAGQRRRIPARIEKVICRGTKTEPTDRFPSMDALLVDLERRPWRRGWAAVIVLITMSLGLQSWMRAAEPSPVCDGGPALAAEVWNDESRSRLRRAFETSGEVFAVDALRSTVAVLDRRSERWVRQFAGACQAHRRGEQSDLLLDRRMACLEERRQETAALVEALIEGQAVELASEAAAALPPLEACRDTSALLAPIPLPEAAQESAVDALRSDLTRVRARRLAGGYPKALASAQQVVAGSQQVGHWPLVAEALLERGLAEESNQQPGPAEATYRDALLAAEAGRHDRVAVEAFLRLVRLVSYERGHVEEARRLAAMGSALLSQLGERRGLRVVLENHLGLVSLQAGDYDDAIAHHRRALALLTTGTSGKPGDDAEDENGGDLARASTHLRLGNALRLAGDLESAETNYRLALGLYRTVHGDAHPEVGLALDRLGGVAAERGENQQARRLRAEAVAILRAAYGDDHPQVADVSANLGAVQLKLGDFEAARRTFLRVEQVYRLTRDESHPKRAAVLGNLGTAHLGLHEGEQALDCFRQALGLTEATLGPDHPATALARFNLASALNELGRPREALAGHRRALTDWRRRLGDEHTLVAHGLTGVGRSLIDLGRAAEALADLRRAEAIWAAADTDPVYPARTRFHLARALWEQGDHKRALELAEQAHAVFAEAGGAVHHLEAATRWLAEHRSRAP